MRTNSISAVVTGIAHHFPERVVTTDEVAAQVSARSPISFSPRAIRVASGIERRHYVAEGEACSDLAAAAGLKALAAAGVRPADVDVVIFAAGSQDVTEPATVNIVQEKIGCLGSSAFDVKNACNGFLNALDVARTKIWLGEADRVLVTSGEVGSAYIDWVVNDVAELRWKLPAYTLGDGGAAMLLEAREGSDRGLLPGRFSSDGSKWRLSTVLSGGTHLRVGDFSHTSLECDGRALHDLAVERIPEAVKAVLASVGWTTDELTLGVPHQTSVHTIAQCAKAIGVGLDRIAVTVDWVGNTAAASVPIALSVAAEKGRLSEGDKVLLVGGAAGFSTAVLPLVW